MVRGRACNGAGTCVQWCGDVRAMVRGPACNGAGAGVRGAAWLDHVYSGNASRKHARAQGLARPARQRRPPPLPSRTKWTRLVPRPVLSGHAKGGLGAGNERRDDDSEEENSHEAPHEADGEALQRSAVRASAGGGVGVSRPLSLSERACRAGERVQRKRVQGAQQKWLQGAQQKWLKPARCGTW